MNEFDKKVILSKIDEIDFNNEDDKYLKIVAKSKLPIIWRWQGSKGWCYWDDNGVRGIHKGIKRENDKKLTKVKLFELLNG
jgi:hypothetical protein